MPKRDQLHIDDQFAKILLSAFEQVNDGIVITDREGHFIFVNQCAADLHGVKRLGTLPENYWKSYSLFRMDGSPFPVKQRPLIRAVTQGDHSIDEMWRIQRSDGTVVVVRGSARPVYDETGEQIASVLTIQDQTNRYNSRKALEEALRAKETLLYEINHRVKNNLQVINSLMRLQKARIYDPAAREVIHTLSRQIEIVAEVHIRLFEDGVSQELEILGFLKGTMVTALAPMCQLMGVTLTTDIEGTASLPIDRAVSLVLTLNELVTNSLNHAFGDTAAPEIKLKVRADETALSVDYHDNGTGVHDLKQLTQGTGFGTIFISGLEHQIGARIRLYDAKPGLGIKITAPLDV